MKIYRVSKFGDYMSGFGGRVWFNWKSKGYSVFNPPSDQEALNFIEWVESVSSLGGTHFMPKDNDHAALWNRLDIIRNSDNSVPNKALSYQGLLHEIERTL
jgi:hypothetical protein